MAENNYLAEKPFSIPHVCREILGVYLSFSQKEQWDKISRERTKKKRGGESKDEEKKRATQNPKIKDPTKQHSHENRMYTQKEEEEEEMGAANSLSEPNRLPYWFATVAQ